jgi:hypothetical protein
MLIQGVLQDIKDPFPGALRGTPAQLAGLGTTRLPVSAPFLGCPTKAVTFEGPLATFLMCHSNVPSGSACSVNANNCSSE